MNCPYCNGEMERGKVLGSGRRNITWRCEDEPTSDMSAILGFMFSAGEDVVSKGGGPVERSWVKGHRCTKCRKMILDY